MNVAGAAGGSAAADSTTTSSGAGSAISFAAATGGVGGNSTSYQSAGPGGDGGGATAIADASTAGGGTATATAVATAGVGGAGSSSGASGAANATSGSETKRGALAQAQSTAVGSSAEAQSTAQTGFYATVIQSVATASSEGTAATDAIAQAGGAGQAFANPGQTAYAFTVGNPDKAYATTLIGAAGNVSDGLLGPILSAAILGANYASDGGGESDTYTATSTMDFVYGGDLVLGLIEDQQSGFTDGAGFESIEFTVSADGATILDKTFTSLGAADSFFDDQVIKLGSSYGPAVDLMFTYTLTADGPGGYGLDFVVGGAVPEPSTWAMMLVGFAGLGYMGYRRSRTPASIGT